MLTLSPLVLGVIFLALGLIFLVIILAILRLLPGLQQLFKSPVKPSAAIQLPHHHEAVLFIQSGGRVAYINQQARELFNSWEEDVNLESLARRTRPNDVFLSLCAGEGQARFTLNGRFVEATSYHAPLDLESDVGTRGMIIVAIRRPQFVLENASPLARLPDQGLSGTATSTFSRDISPEAFRIFAELSQSMAASLDLEVTLRTILESVERLLPSDFFEVTVWDEESQLLIPYRLVGLAGPDRRLAREVERYRVDQGYSGYLVSQQKPLLVRDVSAFREVRPFLDRQKFPYQAYIGVPLLIAGKAVGTLELASLTKENYGEGDLEVLHLLSGPAAIALNNALLYRQTLQRSIELSGLANLAQTVSSIREPQDLYSRLIENILPLMDVEVLGFLVYDENRRILEAQIPFLGIQDNVVEWYQAAIQPGSPAEELWQRAELVVANNAPEDPRLQTLELHHITLAAGIRHTVLAPLTSGGRMLGYLQVANKRDGSAFDQNELRYLAIIAGQVAPIIENATLAQLSRKRAQRAETLRRIASLTSSSATLEEILKYSVLDLARLLQADVSAIFLLDESHGELRLHRGSAFGIAPEVMSQLLRIPTDDPSFKETITHSKKQFITGDLAEEGAILPLYQPLVKDIKLHSLISVPLIARERGIGEILVGSFRLNFFSPGDSQTVATAAGQLAAAIEQATLYSQTDQNLRQRLEQLTALTRVSRELNTTIDLQHLLQRVYDELLRTTGAACGTILLFELSPDERQAAYSPWQAVYEASHQERIRLSIGCPAGENLHPLERLVLQRGETLVVDRYPYQGLSELEQPVDASHENVRSSLIVPIAYQGQIAGLIHLHGNQERQFDESDRDICEALAVQAAIALGNAHRYQEQVRRSELLSQRVETLSRLLEVSHVLQIERPLEQSLEAIAFAIQEATPFDVVLISIFDHVNSQFIRLVAAGLPIQVLAEMRDQPQPWKSIQDLLKPEFRKGRSYFIPQEKISSLPPDVHLHVILPDDDSADELSWHSQDILFVPLFSMDGEPVGLVSVDAPRNNLRPDRATLEALEIFSSQAALMIETHQKVSYLRSQLNRIQGEYLLAQQAMKSAQSHLPTLLQKDLEQTLTIQNLSQRTRRINAGLAIAESVSKRLTRDEVFMALGQETLAQMDFDVILVAESTGGNVNLTHTLGRIPPDVNPKALLGQRNPLRHCLQTGDILLVSNLDESSDWQNVPLLKALDANTFLCLPIYESSNGFLGEPRSEKNKPVAAMLATSRIALSPFTAIDEQLFGLLARQVGVALQNLSLLEETTTRLREVNLLMDFSRQLGSLDPDKIMQTLVESVMQAAPAAQSAMVSLWDQQHQVLVTRACVGYADADQLKQISFHIGEGVPGQVFENRRGVRLDEIDYPHHYNLSPENLLRLRAAHGGRLPVSCLATPIVIGGSDVSAPDTQVGDGSARIEEARAIPLGVLVLENFQAAGAFTDGDLALISSLAQQTALMLENARLYQSSEKRSAQLQALTDISGSIASSLQQEALVADLLDLLKMVLPYDTATLWLRSQDQAAKLGRGSSRSMQVRAARGFTDSDERVGITVNAEDSLLLSEMLATGKPIWVANVSKDRRFRAMMMQDELTGAEDTGALAAIGFERLSWLGIPLILSGEVIGVIALEKTEPNFYTPDDIQLATTFAAQAAIGMQNADLYQESIKRTIELDQRSRTLSILNRLSSELSASLDAEEVLDSAVREFWRMIPCTYVTAILFQGAFHQHSATIREAGDRLSVKAMLSAEYPQDGLKANSPFAPGSILPDSPLFERLWETGGIFNTEDVQEEIELASLAEYLNRYHTRALLVVPVMSGSLTSGDSAAERQFHGLLLAHADQPYRFGVEEVELAKTISNQVAIALQNAQLFEGTSRLTEELEMRVQQRTAELEREHQRSETLLRIITELSASLDLDQVLNRTLHVLSEYVDADRITILIARPGERKLHRLASIGYHMPVASDAPAALDTDQGLAGWIITHRQSVMLEDVQQDERWVKVDYEDNWWSSEEQHRSALGVPLMSGAEALGCLLLFHHRAGHFSPSQLDLVQAAANQVAVAVNNAELYRLIRDQAEDLGNMLRSQQIETSRSKAILEAVADGVLVTDVDRQVTLFNASAEKILNLERSQVLGKSLEQFSGLFGRATLNWMEMIKTWSQDSNSYQPGATYAEQVTLEDGRVISVHLAPVSVRNDFLGTVSIFQDITHQVEVDRLKSEFVATVSHELRTPMTSIKGYVEILLMGAAGALNEQQTHFLQVVKGNADRLAVLVNDLLDVSQIEAGRVSLSIQPVNLEDTANQAIIDLARRMQQDQKSISVHKEYQANLPRVLADPERLRRILDNLLDNAYQYNMPDGHIFVRLHSNGVEAQVDIQDTGMGIQPDERHRIFERFFRGENPLVLGVSGTGLGLSIVQNLVHMQNGRIWFESKGIPGEGSTFSFTLPVYHPDQDRKDETELKYAKDINSRR